MSDLSGRDLVEAINASIAAQTGGDHCQSVAHLMRVPGTINWPTPAKRARGRGETRATVLQADKGATVTLDQMASIFPPPPKDNSERPEVELGDYQLETADTLGLSAFSDIRDQIENPEGEDRSKGAFWLAYMMLRDGFEDGRVVGTLLNPANPVAAHCVEAERPMRAATRALSAAKRKHRKNGAGSDADRGPRSSAGGAGEGTPAPREPTEEGPFDLTDAADWEGKLTPKREWAIDQYLLPSTVNGLYGEGSVGKSLLAQQMCTALAVGTPLFGLPVQQGSSAYLTAEDDIEELQRRQGDICAAFGIKLSDLRGKLHLGSLIDLRDKALMRAAGRGNDQIVPTAMLRRLRATISGLGLKSVALDNIGHFFGGNEIARDEVVAFLGELNAVAREEGCAIILIGHPNKAGAAYSGSTAWQNQVRMQLVLNKPDRTNTPNLRELRREKANYGPPGEYIRVLWHHGAFVPEGDVPEDDPARVNAGNMAQNDIFFDCLDELTAQEVTTSGSSKAANYAPPLMAALPNAIRRGMILSDFVSTLERLKAAKMVEKGDLPWRTANRKAAQGLRRKVRGGGDDDAPM